MNLPESYRQPDFVAGIGRYKTERNLSIPHALADRLITDGRAAAQGRRMGKLPGGGTATAANEPSPQRDFLQYPTTDTMIVLGHTLKLEEEILVNGEYNLADFANQVNAETSVYERVHVGKNTPYVLVVPPEFLRIMRRIATEDPTHASLIEMDEGLHAPLQEALGANRLRRMREMMPAYRQVAKGVIDSLGLSQKTGDEQIARLKELENEAKAGIDQYERELRALGRKPKDELNPFLFNS